jgi:hypothetical protein
VVSTVAGKEKKNADEEALGSTVADPEPEALVGCRPAPPPGDPMEGEEGAAADGGGPVIPLVVTNSFANSSGGMVTNAEARAEEVRGEAASEARAKMHGMVSGLGFGWHSG